MEEQAAELLKQYYEQLDPEVRREQLDQYCEQVPDDQANPLRKELWNLRYTDPKNPEHRIDMFLWQYVNLIYLYKTSEHKIWRKGAAKELKTILPTLGFTAAQAYKEIGSETLYREFGNAALRYFGACGDKSYRKKLFGISSLGDDEWMDKIAMDTWRLSQGLPQRFGLETEWEPLTNALRDAYLAFCPRGEIRLLKCAEKAGKHTD